MKFAIHAPTRTNRSNPAGLLWATLKYWSPAFLIFNFSFLIATCGLDVEDPTPPSPPVWVQKSLPEEWPERGIDAHESGGIILELESNSNSEYVIGYHIYRAVWLMEADSLGDFTKLSIVEAEALSEIAYIDNDVQIGIPHYYKAIAENSSRSMSGSSDTISYTLLRQVRSQTMNPNGQLEPLNENRILAWSNNYTNEMEDYCVTILTNEDKLVLRAIQQPRNYFEGDESFQIPAQITLVSGEVYKWRIDADANYIDGYELSGSESTWAVFSYTAD